MCGRCGGLGTADGCEECKKIRKRKDQIETYQEMDLVIKVNDEKDLWNSAYFFACYPHLRNSDIVKRYTRELDLALECIKEKGNLDRSLFIHAPANYGKQTFANTALHYAELAGKRVTPLIDLDEYKRIQRIAVSYNPFHKVRGLLYEDVIETDLLVIAIPLTLQYRDAASVIADINNKRGRMKMPTVIVSRYSISQINAYDKNKPIGDYLDSSVLNPFKVPAIISV